MLHILLMILKIIGIIIAVILGILVLLICILLFVPLRYEIMAKCDGTLPTLKVKGKITWLLHLVRADAIYKEKKLKWKLRIAWLKKSNVKKQDKHSKKIESTKNEQPSPDIEQSELEVTTSDAGQMESEIVTKEVFEHGDQESEVKQNLEESQKVYEAIEKNETHSEDTKTVEEISEEKSAAYSEERESKTQNDQKEQKNSRSIQKIRKKIFETITKWVQKIKCTAQEIYDKIKVLLQKKEQIVDFLEDETHQDACRRVKKELCWYLKKLRPKKASVKFLYGFEDPYRTGQVLAILSVLYPFIGEFTDITPDFENQIFKGTVYLKGKIYVFHLVKAAVKLLLSKNVRVTFEHIKNLR